MITYLFLIFAGIYSRRYFYFRLIIQLTSCAFVGFRCTLDRQRLIENIIDYLKQTK